MHVPVVLLHGFLGRGADWDAVRARLPAAWDVRAPDLPGHGSATGLDAQAYTMDGAAERVLAGLDGPADVVGYSMGGRLALHLAVTRPGGVRRLVMVSASPGLETETERAARRRLDAERAAEIAEDLPGFLHAWAALPLFATLPAATARRRLAAQCDNDPDELRRSLEGMGTGAQPSHWDALRRLPDHSLAITGRLDAKFVAIARAMRARAGERLAVAVVPGAGHAPHLERSETTAQRILSALR